MLNRILLLALAGSLGTLGRYGLSTMIFRLFPLQPQAGTWVVNMLGCLIMGIIWSIFKEFNLISSETRLILTVGFLGAFTTFSAYIFDSMMYLEERRYLALAIYLIAQNILGLLALLGGIILSSRTISIILKL